MESYFSREELKQMGFKGLGEDVKISRRAALYSVDHIEIGNRVRIDDFVFLSGGKGIQIGDFVHIAPYSGLYGKNGIQIGSYVNISSRVSVYSTSDDYSGEFMTGPLVDQQFIHDVGSGRKIMIDDYVIIGTGSVLLPGAILHRGVAVGAMSLVKEELTELKMYAGIPARYIKERSDKFLEKFRM